MSRYPAMFERLHQAGEGAFGAFLMLGDPDLETSARLLDAAVAGGADMIKVGIPFSDPVAGAAPWFRPPQGERFAPARGSATAFRLLREFRARDGDTPLGILTYANLVAARGRDRFVADAADAGVDSLLVADVPSLEAGPSAEATRSAGNRPGDDRGAQHSWSDADPDFTTLLWLHLLRGARRRNR